MYRLRWYRRAFTRLGASSKCWVGKTSYFRAKCVNITRLMALTAAALLQTSRCLQLVFTSRGFVSVSWVSCFIRFRNRFRGQLMRFLVCRLSGPRPTVSAVDATSHLETVANSRDWWLHGPLCLELLAKTWRSWSIVHSSSYTHRTFCCESSGERM